MSELGERFVPIDRSYGSFVADRLMMWQICRVYFGPLASWKAQITAERLNAGHSVPSGPTLARLALRKRCRL